MPHGGHLHASTDPRSRRDEQIRYALSGAIAFGYSPVEHFVGYFTGSEALHADAWHLFADALQSVVALTIISGVRMFGAWENRFREYGGYVQALTMIAAAVFILTQLHTVGARSTSYFWVVIVTATASTLVGFVRFRILHQGMPWEVLTTVWHAYRRDHKLNATYLAELLHVTTDIGMSILAVLAGTAGLLGWYSADEKMAWVIVAWLVLCSLIIAVFAGRHRHDHGHVH